MVLGATAVAGAANKSRCRFTSLREIPVNIDMRETFVGRPRIPNSSLATETKTDLDSSENSRQVMPHLRTTEAIGLSKARQDERTVFFILSSIIGAIYPNIGKSQRYWWFFRKTHGIRRSPDKLVLSSGCEVFAGVSIQYVILEAGNTWADKVFANKKVQRSDGMVVQQV